MAVKVEIVLQDDGQVQVSGPLDDKILCLGLLEIARMSVHKFEKKLVSPVDGNAVKLFPFPRRS